MTNYRDAKYQIPASGITSGTVADARISESSVTQHGVTFDDNKLQSNIALLGFKTAVNGSLAKYSLQDQIIDEYEDATGIDASASTYDDLTAGVYKGKGVSVGDVLTSTGGGGAGSRSINSGADGGSGGGAGQDGDDPGDGTANQGNDGGTGYDWNLGAGGGGGGGASAAGINASLNTGGNGGDGYTEGSSAVYDWTLADGTTATFNIDGTGTQYAGGGGGSGKSTGGNGVFGGGSGRTGTSDGLDATASRGAGGGGGGVNGGNGSDGVVIFRYLTSAGTATGDADATGTAGSYNWAKFTSSGNFIISFATNVDVFVLAGGGGGGSGLNYGAGGEGGGGGAGGFKYFRQKSLIAGTYPVVIGSGGTGTDAHAERGDNGTNSTVTEPDTDTVENLTLQSTDTTASTQATNADMVMLMENAEGTATLNTDIKGYVSRDSGTTFTQGTLVDEGTWGTNKKILAFHDLDISGQPSGTDMCYKITTHNQVASSLETKIHATSIGWKA